MEKLTEEELSEEEVYETEGSSNKQKKLLIAGAALAGALIVLAVILSFVGAGKKSGKEAPVAAAPENPSAGADPSLAGEQQAQPPEEQPVNPKQLAAKYGYGLTIKDIQEKIDSAKRYADRWDKEARLAGFIGIYGNMDTTGNGQLKPDKAYLLLYTAKFSPDEEYLVVLDENNKVIKRNKGNFDSSPTGASNQLGYLVPAEVKIDMAEAFAIAANSLDRNHIELYPESKDSSISLGLGYNKKEGYVWQYDFKKGRDLLARVSLKADTGEIIVKYPE